MTLLCALVVARFGASAPLRLEAESATLSGPSVSSAGAGFSGSGYVTGFVHGNDWAAWRAEAKAGLYDLAIGYRTPGGAKGYEVRVNGHGQSGMFKDTGGRFESIPAGKVELRDGVNEIAVGKGWGYYDIDYVELRPTKPFPMPLRPSTKLSDPRATPEARRLMSRLVSLYGRKTLSGQYDIGESDFVRRATGKSPAILGGDLMAYSPSRLPFGEKNNQSVERTIEEAKRGAIVTLSWHWNAPKDLLDKKYKNERGEEVDASWYRGFYTTATTFDVAKALSNPSSEDYRLLLRDIDAIAVQLRKFQNARVPLLWRPLHEAEGGWFWWGAKGAEPLKKLWRLMFERLTQHHGLHNLIWVFNSARPEWYPGDDVVDVMSVDQYPSDRTDPLPVNWEELAARFNGKKILALAEFPGAPDIERMFRFGVRWSYFVSWTGGVGPKSTPPDLLKRTYRSRHTQNR